MSAPETPTPQQLPLPARSRVRDTIAAARERIRVARAQVGLDERDDWDVEHPAEARNENLDVPYGLRIVAAWAWRLLVLAAAGYVLLWLVGRLAAVVIPLTIALLLSAMLSPAVHMLRTKLRLAPSLATAIVLIGGLVLAVGTLTLLITQIVSGAPELSAKAGEGGGQIRDWLRDGPLNLSTQELDSALKASRIWIQDNRQSLTSGIFATATAGVEALVSIILILFITFFFLRDGRRLWRFAMVLVPGNARRPLMEAGLAAWQTLVAYVRATILVAFIDAIGIGLALLILGVDFALVLAALVFLAAFVPIVGATVSGVVAVLVALVDEGPLTALFVLGAVILVQQLEGHVLQPLIMGRAVSIHPLAVIVALAAGVVVAGIIGALVAVPIVAVLNTAVRHLHHRGRERPPEAVVVSADPSP